MIDAEALPGDVREATARHLAAADAVALGLIQALYVTGSVALGDYQPGRSDIDFMAFTSRPVSADDVALLRDMHAGFPPHPCYDGIYVSWDERETVPDDEQPRPHIVAGQFRVDDCHELTPSTWTEFARYAIAIRGPQARELGVSVPRKRLNAWNLGNLNGYWLGRAAEAERVLADRDPDGLANPEGVVWLALGAARLHYTLATGDITTKSGAGRYALELFPAYAEVITAALAWRATGVGEFSNAAGLRSAHLVQAIVADANKR